MVVSIQPLMGTLARKPIPVIPTFNGGNQSVADLRALGSTMASSSTTTATPTAGGALTVNGQSVGSYDYHIISGPVTLASFASTDWFTATQDTSSAIVVVRGDLTINSGITVQPTVRKLFAVVYVQGNLVLNGSVSMSLLGANHSATPAVPIQVATGTFGTYSNPTIPAAGGAGGTAVTTTGSGRVGGNGATFASGGGGSGSAGGWSVSATSGAGAAGTCFSGGGGGGAAYNQSGVSGNIGGTAGANGGPGGAGVGLLSGGGGGVGNPSGTVYGTIQTGTGGTLIVIVEGTVTGAGSLTARGGNVAESAYGAPYSSQSIQATGWAGGASGGGIVMLFGKSISGPTLSASGGTSASGSFIATPGGNGGTGSATTLIIP